MMNTLLSSFYLATARSLTLARLAAIPFFLFLLIQTYRQGGQLWGTSLIALYCFIALSDLLDGIFARKAGAPSRFWGQLDATADIAFNTLSLGIAAWIGSVGPWVPAGVAVLGGQFLMRNLSHPKAGAKQLQEDRTGKVAGVVYYLLVGAVALELSLQGDAGRWLVARSGDAVFLYTLLLLARRKTRLGTPSFEKEVGVGPGQKNHTKGPVH